MDNQLGFHFLLRLSMTVFFVLLHEDALSLPFYLYHRSLTNLVILGLSKTRQFTRGKNKKQKSQQLYYSFSICFVKRTNCFERER